MAPLPFRADCTSASKPVRDARRPGGRIAELGRAGHAGGVAGGALGLEHFLAALERPVGIADLHGAHLADALGDGPLEVLRGHAAQRVAFGLGAAGRLVFADHVGHQRDDDEHRNDKREEHRQQQLFRGLDRAGVGFFLRAVAHGVLKVIGGVENNL